MQTNKSAGQLASSGEFQIEFDDIYKNIPLFQTFVDSMWVDKYSNYFYQTYFPKASLPLAVNPKGASLYYIDERQITGTSNAMSRAKYSDMPAEGYKGKQPHTGSIGDFGKAHVLQGKDKQMYEKLNKQLDGNLQLYKMYVDYVSGMLDAHYAQINLMAAQKMSYTRFSNADYLDVSYDIPITTPYEVDEEKRDIACGEKIWSDPDATIIDDIRNLVEDFRTETGYTGALSLKMERDFYYNVFLRNNQVKTLVSSYALSNGSILPNGYMATDESFKAWNAANGGYIPTIDLIQQESLIQGVKETTAVKGWKPGIVVLSPAGKQGELVWSLSEEYNLLDNVQSFAVATYDGGLLSLMNRVNTNGRLPEWVTEVIGSYEPVLDEWNFHWCINSNKATA